MMHRFYVFVAVLVSVFLVSLIVLPTVFEKRITHKEGNGSGTEYGLAKKIGAHTALAKEKEVVTEAPPPPVTHIATPSVVKGIYMTSWVAGTPKLRQKLVDLADQTEVNTIVLDVKDYSGRIVFPVESESLKKMGGEEVRIADFREFIQHLHEKNIYVVARVAVFQDAYMSKTHPHLAVKTKTGEVWRDRKGLSWIDPGAREYWDYIRDIAIETHNQGVDEINFDYIRFPSDGNMTDISFPWSSTTPKTVVMKEFFSYLDREVRQKGIPTSADLFGMTTTATDDMGIGQIFTDALPYFDYISPMIYPSHYPPTFGGFELPEKHPYEVIQIALAGATSRAKMASTSIQKIRPWLQDFGLKVTYGEQEVRDQIRATYDAGLSSWLLWSASNRYTESALEKETENLDSQTR